MQKNAKIIFFGTSGFAVPALEALKKEGYDIVAVVTNPDEPTGRKKVPTPPPIKTKAQSLGLKVLQPEKLKNDSALVLSLSSLGPDVGIVAAYGKIIPQEIFGLPRRGTLNIHPSLLPKYRGPTPIQTTILKGEKETGVTIIKIDGEVDHGLIVATSDKRQATKKSYKELENELAKLGAELLIKTLPDYLAGNIEPRPQDHSQATSTKKFTREDAKIDWPKTAEEIDRQIRALNPEPGTWTTWNDKILKILEAEPLMTETSQWQIGQVFQEEKKIAVKMGADSLVLKTVQLEGKKPMPVGDFVRGNRNFIGAVLE